ncbi:MAG TPA: FUSC family protein [Mycobacteriales bacterium]|nr:FUSC family protein [Mycobacteriales bacterium]
MPALAAVQDAVRRRAAASAKRVRDGAWSVVQCALGASLAWLAATTLLGHERPFFACVAAVVCLGVRAAQRLRRVLELAVGVTVGVAVGEALVGLIGTGAWQVGLVVGLALALALALDGGTLVTAQAGLQAVFVVALPRVPGGDVARWQDAMVGGLTALLVAALLPADPWRDARRRGAAVLAELAAVLREAAGAARREDAASAAFALSRARATQPRLDAWSEALRTGHDITQLTPLRRDAGTWRRSGELAAGVDRATRNLRVLVRRVLFALGEGEPLPDRLAGDLEELAAALDVLAADLEARQEACARLTALAGRLSLDPAAGVSGTVVVAQLRSAVVDLLEGLGVEPRAARAALPPPGS